MATFYANARGGSDSNNGTSWALAKATLSGVNGVASAGDTVLCHGYFVGAIPVSKQLFWVGFGYCVFDVNQGAAVTPASNTIYRGITFKNASVLFSSSSVNVTFQFCVFTEISSYCNYAFGSVTHRYENCLFYNNSANVGCLYLGSVSAVVSIKNCVFYGNTIDLNFYVNTSVYVTNTCFGSPIMAYSASGVTYATSGYWIGDWNVFDFANGKCVVAGVDKTTLATFKTSVQTGFPVGETNAIDRVWRTDVGDYVNRAFRSNPSGYLLTAGASSTPSGLYLPALTVSGNTNASILSGGISAGVVYDSFGKLVLDAGYTVGTFSTDVIDLGANISVNCVEFLTSGEFATNFHLDADTGDSPNYHTYEVRGSQTTFLKGAGSPSWTTVPRGAELGAYISTACRYWQIRVTMRGLY